MLLCCQVKVMLWGREIDKGFAVLDVRNEGFLVGNSWEGVIDKVRYLFIIL